MNKHSTAPTGARATAAILLERILEQGFTTDVLWDDPAVDRLPEADRRLLHEIVLGTLRELALIDALLDALCRRPTRHLAPQLRAVLRTGAYQILFLEKIPAYAAVDESVALVRGFGFTGQAGFANAVLRRIAQVKDPAAFLKTDPASPGGMALLYSHPQFLVERWLERHPLSLVTQWLRRSALPPEHFIIVQDRRVSPEVFLEQARRLGVDCVQLWPDAPVLEVQGPIRPIDPLLEQGLAFPQDIGSWSLVEAIPAGTYQTVLDLCAAPGGKSFALRLRFPTARVIAMDTSVSRLSSLVNRARTLQLPLEGVLAGDACRPPLLDASADLVLVDAPCSGTGTLRKNPDIRWRLTPEDILRLARLQQELLDQAAPLVRRGGVLVYSTCSAEDEENQGVVTAFLSRQGSRFKVLPPQGRLAELTTPDGYFQTFPASAKGEGLFGAFLQRT